MNQMLDERSQEQLLIATNGAFDPDARALPSGLRSTAILTGMQVYKFTHANMTLSAAHDLRSRMQDQYNHLFTYLPNNMLPTEFSVIESAARPDRAKVLSTQPYEPGDTLKGYFEKSHAKFGPTLDFLAQALYMYRNSHKMPDIANIEGKFDIFNDANVVISPSGHPTLVDDAFGRMQGNPFTGPFWHFAIFLGAHRGVRDLRELQAERERERERKRLG